MSGNIIEQAPTLTAIGRTFVHVNCPNCGAEQRFEYGVIKGFEARCDDCQSLFIVETVS